LQQYGRFRRDSGCVSWARRTAVRPSGAG